jgi:hypothetical protein
MAPSLQIIADGTWRIASAVDREESQPEPAFDFDVEVRETDD